MLHHLAARLPDPRSTVVLVGFQAVQTRGRLLAEGARELKLLGRYVPVRAEVVDLPAFSVHADRDELVAWLGTATAPPNAVILALGANDGLRAVDPALTEANLRKIVVRLKQDGIPVLMAGMVAPPNLGRDFGTRYAGAFAAVAKDTGILFYPFFLDGVAAERGLNQPDGIHPNPKGVGVIVERILPKS